MSQPAGDPVSGHRIPDGPADDDTGPAGCPANRIVAVNRTAAVNRTDAGTGPSGGRIRATQKVDDEGRRPRPDPPARQRAVLQGMHDTQRPR